MEATSGEPRPLGRVWWLDPRALAVRTPRVDRILYLGAFAWTALFAAGAALEQHFFVLRRYDLGNFTQAVWSTAHGRILQVTEVGGEQVSRLGIHVDPIIVGLAPLWWIWSSPNLLLVVHVIALSFGALPLYWLGRKHLRSKRDAAFVSAAYLMCPAVAWNALGEFDAVALAVPFLLLGVWFLDEDRLWAFAAVAVLAVLCQEQIGLVVACLGVAYGWRTKRVVPAALIAAFGLTATMVDLYVVLPHFSDGSPYLARFTGVGGSPGGVVTTFLTHPLRIVFRVLNPAHLFGLALLVVPVLLLCFRSSLIFAAVPQFAFLLLSIRPQDIDPQSQNVLPVLPFVFAGAVYALARLEGRSRWKPEHVLFASIACAVVIGPLNPAALPHPSLSHAAAERRAVAIVPSSAAISVTNHLGSHLAARRRLYVFPVIGKATWIVVDKRDDDLPDMKWLRKRQGTELGARDLPEQPGLMRRELGKLATDPRWTRVFSRDGVMVFRRLRD
jgi:uncharacterized membrane protein